MINVIYYIMTIIFPKNAYICLFEIHPYKFLYFFRTFWRNPIEAIFFTEMSWTLGSHIHIPLQFNIFWINLLNYVFL